MVENSAATENTGEFVQPIDRAEHQDTTREEPVEQTEYSEDEVEQLVVKLREQGFSPSQIGMRLRDQYGIGSVQEATGKSITAILKDEDVALEIPEDLENVVRRAVNLREHVEENPGDGNADHQLQQAEAQIRSMAGYYRENGELPQDWKYDPDRARLLIS